MQIPKIRFFWYSGTDFRQFKWGMRGIRFDYGEYAHNVHLDSLAFACGYTWKIKWSNGIKAWKRLLMLGKAAW